MFVRRFLPYSQTFIHDEIRTHERYTVDVFCRSRLNENRFPHNRVVTPSAFGSDWLGARLYENLGYWPPFDTRLGDTDYALVHAHFGTEAVYALPYVVRHDYPFIVTFHGADVADLFGPRRFLPRQWRYWSLAGRIFETADRLLAASTELAELLVELGAPRDKVHVHRLGIDLSTFRRAEEERAEPRITMVGRFTEKKGFRYALRACGQVLTGDTPGTITMLGNGELEPDLRRIVRETNLGDRVDFRGAVPHDEVAETLARTDIMMCPSVVTATHDRDSGLIVAKEASACEVPVIGTYHGGIPSIVDDRKTGLLVPERDVDALADALHTLLHDADLRRQLGKAARTKMEKEFDLATQIQKLERHYDDIQERRRSR